METTVVFRYSPFIFAVFFSTALSLETPLNATPTFSFSFDRFGNDSRWDTEIVLSGDAQIGDAAIKMTRSGGPSTGRIMSRKPIRFLGRNPSFSTDFTFFLSPDDGGTLAFSVTPSRIQHAAVDGNGAGLSHSGLAVTFNSVTYPRPGFLSEKLIQIAVTTEIYTKSTHLSDSSLVLNSGVKLRTWIDYNVDAKRVEVRLSKSEAPKPFNASISCPVDLADLLQREEMSVSLISSSQKSSQPGTVYSWSFTSRHGEPYRMHSEPLNPETVLVHPLEALPIQHTRNYPWRLLMALVCGAAFGALVVFFIMLMRSAFGEQRQVAPVEDDVRSVELGYEKVDLVDDKRMKGEEATRQRP